MSRTLAREDAFKLVFEMEITGIAANDALSYLYDTAEKSNEMWAQHSISEVNKKYIETAVLGIETNKDKINSLIEPKLKGWTIKRISKVNLALLQLAIYEILYFEDIPEKVSVNEAVQLAKKYGGPEAGSFVNGVLGAILKDEIKEGN